jgi:DNA-binding MarR family transcriptional regulator
LTPPSTDAYEFGRDLANRIKRWKNLSEKSIARLGIPLGEFRVLMSLSEYGSRPMAELAKDQVITQAAITGIVDNLEQLGLAVRERSETDRRVVKVSITKKGEEEVKKGQRLYRTFIEKSTSRISAAELHALLKTLDRMLSAADNVQ